MRSLTIISLLFSLLFLSSCTNEKRQDDESFSISTRINKDPSSLNPIKTSSSTEAIINQYIFLHLANYHPHSLELIPVLLESIPEGKITDSGENKGTLRFDCRIKEQATWDDGSAVTGYDYLFTIKTIRFDPLKVNPSLRSIFREMIDIQVNNKDPKSFSIFVNKDYFLARELSLISEVLPEYLYDPGKSLRKIDFKSMYEKTGSDFSVENDSLQQFIDFFNHADCGRTLVAGCGPYKLVDWQTNQKLILEQKTNWWGEEFADNPYLKAYPNRIEFSIIPSENAALNELKNGSLDMIYRMDGMNFTKLQEDEKIKDKLTFHNPAQLKYYFIGINNHSPFFNNKQSRKALSHLLDLDAFIKNQENGSGVRLIGPIHPIRSYYNDTLPPIQPDVRKARALLADAGWIDSNQNGILDKTVEGELLEFRPQMLITGGSISKNIALTLQERAKEVGIDIEVITKNSKLINSEIANRNFDLYPTGLNVGLYPEDLYQSWHSSNDYPGGRNRFGFSNAEADKIIEEIRFSKDSTELDNLYRQIEALIYEEQPLLFLYAPTNNIVVNARFIPEITVKKHGFFLNAFRLQE